MASGSRRIIPDGLDGAVLPAAISELGRTHARYVRQSARRPLVARATLVAALSAAAACAATQWGNVEGFMTSAQARGSCWPYRTARQRRLEIARRAEPTRNGNTAPTRKGDADIAWPERKTNPMERHAQVKKMAIQPASWSEKPKPPTLPPDLFKPKQSLSQNFLADPNYIHKIVESVEDDSPGGRCVVELGPGTGAITTRLQPRYPDMLGIELDQRAIRVLAQNVPGVTVVRSDALLVNYTKIAEIRGGPLNIVGNVPFHVVSQIIFTLADHAKSVKMAHVTMQKEVAERIVARPNTKKYGILSVAFQLYSDPKLLFDLPPTAFFPRPNVISSYIKLDFESAQERREAMDIDPRNLRNLTNRAFRKRRKMMSNSLASLLQCHTTLIDELPPEYAGLRPEQIEPWEFVHLTQLIFGKKEFPKHLRRAWRGEFGRTVRGD